MRGTRPTLAVLADELGVSRTTVSNAFSRPDQLSEELRDRVLAAAARHGYTGPDPLARGLARGRVGIVALLMGIPAGSALADPAVRVILDGLAGTLSDAETGLLLVPRTADVSQPIATVPADGFVILCMDNDDPMTAAARRRRLPIVGFDLARQRGIVAVRIDDAGGADAAARHVASLGHRRVGVVTLPFRRGSSGGPVDADGKRGARQQLAVDRLDGYVRGLGGIVPATVWEAAGYDRASGAAAAAALLGAEPTITAILASSDELALGIVDELHRRGRRVPDDISVVGFDDIDDAARGAVPLTTVRQPLYERGVEAAELMLQLLAGKRPRPPRVTGVELVVRASTAAPPT
jgi:DNA-binding LacI/PurR family transcriptional regulator